MEYFDKYSVRYMILYNRIPNWKEYTSLLMYNIIKSSTISHNYKAIWEVHVAVANYSRDESTKMNV